MCRLNHSKNHRNSNKYRYRSYRSVLIREPRMFMKTVKKIINFDDAYSILCCNDTHYVTEEIFNNLQGLIKLGLLNSDFISMNGKLNRHEFITTSNEYVLFPINYKSIINKMCEFLNIDITSVNNNFIDVDEDVCLIKFCLVHQIHGNFERKIRSLKSVDLIRYMMMLR